MYIAMMKEKKKILAKFLYILKSSNTTFNVYVKKFNDLCALFGM